MRWRRTSKRVLSRDLHVCRIVPGCPQRATVADHIIPATLETPDSLFFDERNLRAGCREHNIARGLTEPLERASPVASTTVTGDYS